MRIADDGLQRRRIIVLRGVSFAASCGAAVFFGTSFISGLPLSSAALIAAATGAIAISLAFAYHRKFPPEVPETLHEGPAVNAKEAPEDSTPWTLGGMALAAFTVPVFVVVMVLLRFFVRLGLISAIWLANSAASLAPALAAAGCCLLVLACVEFGIELPLRKHWGLPLEDAPRRMST